MKAILTWHSIDDSASVISTRREDLERELDGLADAGVEVVRLDEIVNVDASKHAVALTFDDGYSNFGSSVVPLLNERRLPATVFVCPGYVGRGNDWDAGSSIIPRLALMSWNELAALPLDLIDIGAHGYNHVSLSGHGRKALDREITSCVSEISEFTLRTPRSFAFPYGDADAAAHEVVAESFGIACTTRFDLIRRNDSPLSLPRLDAYYFRDNDELRHFGTRRFAANVKLRSAGRTARASLQRTSRRRSG